MLVSIIYVVGSKSFRADQLFKVTEIKQLCYFSTQSPFISTRFSTDTLTSPQVALYIPHSIFHLARLLYVRSETFGPYYFQRKTSTVSRIQTSSTSMKRHLSARGEKDSSPLRFFYMQVSLYYASPMEPVQNKCIFYVVIVYYKIYCCHCVSFQEFCVYV